MSQQLDSKCLYFILWYERKLLFPVELYYKAIITKNICVQTYFVHPWECHANLGYSLWYHFLMVTIYDKHFLQ